MRILLVGSEEVYSIENFYVKYLREAGEEVYIYPAQSHFYKYYYRHLYRKILFKAGLSTILHRINADLLKKTDEFKPDIVWVFKGMELFPATLEAIKRKGILVVNYNPDNPFLFTGKGSGNENVTQSIGLYDMHFTYDRAIQEKLEKEYAARTAYLPFGFDISEKEYGECAMQQEIGKVCFLGNPDGQRVRFMKKLAESGIEIDIYGHDWNKFLNHPRIQIYGPAYGIDTWKTLRRYRIQLNLMRIHNEHSHNMRTFEVPGVGGIMLAPDTSDHRIFFQDQKEIFLFSTEADCTEKIRSILELTKNGADLVRSNARERSLNSGYSYKDRTSFVIKQLELLYA